MTVERPAALPEQMTTPSMPVTGHTKAMRQRVHNTGQAVFLPQWLVTIRRASGTFYENTVLDSAKTSMSGKARTRNAFLY